MHNSNFTVRYRIPALQGARDALSVLQAAATAAEGLAQLPLKIPEIRPHVFRHTNAAWLLSAGARR